MGRENGTPLPSVKGIKQVPSSVAEQEQTKFYDMRRGITEDFQRLAKL